MAEEAAPSVELATRIGHLHQMALDERVLGKDFREHADAIQKLFDDGAAGPLHKKLWREYQDCWRAFRKRQDELKAASDEVWAGVQPWLTAMKEAAEAARTPEAVREANDRVRELRRGLRKLDGLGPGDRRKGHAALDEIQAIIDASRDELGKEHGERARAAIDAALKAFDDAPPGEAWAALKEARHVLGGCWLKQKLRKKLSAELDGLYDRLKERRDAHRQEQRERQEEWEAHQHQRLEELRDRIGRCERFITRQTELAERCTQRAFDAFEPEFAVRMHDYAHEHEQNANGAKGSLKRMQRELRQIEGRLGRSRSRTGPPEGSDSGGEPAAEPSETGEAQAAPPEEAAPRRKRRRRRRRRRKTPGAPESSGSAESSSRASQESSAADPGGGAPAQEVSSPPSHSSS